MGAQAVLDNQAQQVLNLLEDVRYWFANHVIGGKVTDGDTTQATGASGALNFDADVSAISEIVVDEELYGTLAAGTDVDATAGAGVTWGATSGVEVRFALVLDVDDGSPGWDALPGEVAATDASVAPTDAEISETLGHDNWIRVSDIKIVRTGDTTVTFTAYDGERNMVKGFGPIMRTETELRTGEHADA